MNKAKQNNWKRKEHITITKNKGQSKTKKKQKHGDKHIMKHANSLGK